MSEEEKEMPLSAGQAAAEIVNDNENADPSKEETKEMPEETKPVSSFQSTEGLPVAKQSKGTGWKVATFIFLILTLCGAGFSAYLILVKDNPITGCTSLNTDHVTTATKCDVKEEANNNTTPESTPEISENSNGDFVFTFKKSGLKLNLGSNFETINYEYSSEPNGMIEKLTLGGLSKNTTGAQNYPGFVYGNDNSDVAVTIEEQNNHWDSFASVFIMTNAQYDNLVSSGEGVYMGQKAYSNDQYTVLYRGPQNVTSQSDWEQDWEVRTANAFKEAILNESNWSTTK